ncbi:BipA protein, partial [Vibrio parahaemolyticus AQ3810]
MLVDRGCRLTVVPAETSAEEVLALNPDGVFLSNGPGDPEPCTYAIEATKVFLEKGLPIFGICLGHQILALASGAQTVKMKFGHHGANHPVKDLERNVVMITSQNHGFAADEATLPENLRATHVSLFDGSLQGIHRTDKPAFNWNDYRINIVDTPGHADFGGEVERIMSMVDSVLLIVDAVDGPMPQTRFVTQKAFAHGLKPIVVINKIDRPGARPDWVMDQVFDLFDNLGATDDQLDFKVVYASALNGWASLEEGETGENMEPLFQTIVDVVDAPNVDLDGPLQMQVSQLDYSSYVGVIGVARVTRGSVKANQQVTIIGADGKTRNGKVGTVMGYLGLERHEVEQANAGDIIAITGLGELKISDTICAQNAVEA